jgi:hypothetical protein
MLGSAKARKDRRGDRGANVKVFLFRDDIARNAHDHGMPVSKGELVRDMMERFAGREDFPPPDERTARRKASAVW